MGLEGGGRSGLASAARWLWLAAVIVLAASAPAHEAPTVEQLKARIATAQAADRVRICVEIAQKQMNEVDRLYAANDFGKAQAALNDVVAYAGLARDYAIQSRKHQKQTEIAARAMARRLDAILHTLAREDQPPVKDALDQMEHVRDDLLAAMFKKGA